MEERARRLGEGKILHERNVKKIPCPEGHQTDKVVGGGGDGGRSRKRHYREDKEMREGEDGRRYRKERENDITTTTHLISRVILL